MINVLDYKKNIDIAVQKVVNKNKNYLRDIEDLRQEAYIQAIKMSKSYKPHKSKFSSYLYEYLPKNLERAYLKNNSLIGLPTHLYDKRKLYFTNSEQLSSNQYRFLENYFDNKTVIFYDDRELDNAGSKEDEIDSKIDRQLLNNRLKKASRVLDFQNRYIYLRKFFSENDVVDNYTIAEELNCSHQNVSNRLRKVIYKKVRSKLERMEDV